MAARVHSRLHSRAWRANVIRIGGFEGGAFRGGAFGGGAFGGGAFGGGYSSSNPRQWLGALWRGLPPRGSVEPPRAVRHASGRRRGRARALQSAGAVDGLLVPFCSNCVFHCWPILAVTELVFTWAARQWGVVGTRGEGL